MVIRKRRFLLSLGWLVLLGSFAQLAYRVLMVTLNPQLPGQEVSQALHVLPLGVIAGGGMLLIRGLTIRWEWQRIRRRSNIVVTPRHIMREEAWVRAGIHLGVWSAYFFVLFVASVFLKIFFLDDIWPLVPILSIFQRRWITHMPIALALFYLGAPSICVPAGWFWMQGLGRAHGMHNSATPRPKPQRQPPAHW